jgi:hypothetical protein
MRYYIIFTEYLFKSVLLVLGVFKFKICPVYLKIIELFRCTSTKHSLICLIVLKEMVSQAQILVVEKNFDVGFIRKGFPKAATAPHEKISKCC